MGLGCSAFTLGVGTLACGTLGGAIAGGLTAGLKGGDIGDVLLGAVGGAAFGAAGGALGAVGGALIGKGAQALFGGLLARQGLAAAGGSALSAGLRNAGNTAMNLVNADARALCSSAGMKGLAGFHREVLKSPVKGVYGAIMKDSTPAAVAGGSIQSFLPGNLGDEVKFRAENLIGGVLTNMFG